MATLLLRDSELADLVDLAEIVRVVDAALAAAGRGAAAESERIADLAPGSDGTREQAVDTRAHAVPERWVRAVHGAAAAAIASKHLAVGSPRTVGIVGSGPIARLLLAAHEEIFGAIDVRCADADRAGAERLAAECGGTVSTVERACACDIVCATTAGPAPVLEAAWIDRGTHINDVGPLGSGSGPLDPVLVSRAKVVIAGYPEPDHAVHATLGDVVAGVRAGRESDEITLFTAAGAVPGTLAVARLLAARAGERGAPPSNLFN